MLKQLNQSESTEAMEDYSTVFLTPKLPLMNKMSPQRSGTATPPLQASVSVPFKWEEEPGKPRLCTALIALHEPEAKFLELPPCRMPLITKTPSPTTVLDGPYNLSRPKFSSFRIFRENHDSFDSYSSASPESAVDDMWIGKKINGRRTPANGFLSRTNLKWRGGKREFGGDVVGYFSPVYSVAGCDSDTESCKKVKMEGKLKRLASISTISDRPTTRTKLWAAIYEGIKQVIPWKSAKKSQK
ncbi:uncharacterized protein At4g00950-like [Henckelia pumila]|uniref:uncharacterized protein At4g00950-like n=1 Tax=Henckelia pumila TaxID=405737 RepID=UPI003C6DC6D2